MTAPEPSAQPGAEPTGTIMHRKARAGRAEHQSRAMSLAKALRLTLAKVADDLFDLSMAVIAVRRESCAGDALTQALTDAGLLVLLEGPMRSRGAAILDVPLVAGLIQQQTMGKVLEVECDPARLMTPTDAAISAPFLDALMARVAPLPDDVEDQALISGYRFGAWIEDQRVLCMALEAHRYEIIHLSLDIAGGAQQGNLTLCLPHADADAHPEDHDFAEVGGDHGPSVEAPAVTLSETVQNLRADLRIALAQLRMPVRELSQLEVGAMLDLGRAEFDDVRVQSLDGAPVGRGVLGQIDGQRAVQVAEALAKPMQQTLDCTRNNTSGSTGATGPALAGLPGSRDDMPPMPDMPELDDLPAMSTEEVPREPPALLDLPDMSDLPDFEDMPSLASMKAG